MRHGQNSWAPSWRKAFSLAAAVLLVLLTAGPASHAENNWEIMRDPTINRGRVLNLFGQPQQAAPQKAAPRPKPTAQRRTVAPSTVIVHDQVAPVKTDPTSFVIVMGDTLAEQLAGGIDEAFADRPDVAIVRKTRADTGLARSDFYDWPKAANELMASDEKITVGVMLLGANDRQSIKEGETSQEPFSDRWKELYRQRIAAIAAAFAARKVPLVWVGAPPMQNTRLSADMITLNDMFRQQVDLAGGTYVDIWDGFIDSDNRYTMSGPDLSGQTARLRIADGVHFTRAGARKAAHFADAPIRRLISAPPPQTIIALPSTGEGKPGVTGDAGAPPPSVEEMINRMAGHAPGLAAAPLPAIPAIPVKPAAGPILQLTGIMPAKDARLIGDIAAARGTGYQAGEVEHVFGDGVAPAPKAGRADDFRWPRR